MAERRRPPICTLVTNQDANSIRRLAATARSAKQRMWLQLLAEIIEYQAERDIRRMRRFPFVGVRPARLLVR